MFVHSPEKGKNFLKPFVSNVDFFVPNKMLNNFFSRLQFEEKEILGCSEMFFFDANTFWSDVILEHVAKLCSATALPTLLIILPL